MLTMGRRSFQRSVEAMTMACDSSTPRSLTVLDRYTVYYWNEEFAVLERLVYSVRDSHNDDYETIINLK